MVVLVINSGSFSIKTHVFESVNKERFVLNLNKVINNENDDNIDGFKDVKDYFYKLNFFLSEKLHLCITDVDYVVIRIVCSGVKLKNFEHPTNEIVSKLEENSYLSPLHTLNVKVLEECLKMLHKDKIILASDSWFYNDMPDYVKKYAIPSTIANKYNAIKNGYHGYSHFYLSDYIINKSTYPSKKLITCHMGGGISISAIESGKCIDTSMGFSCATGVPMGSRCGDIDAVAALFLMDKMNLSAKEMINYLFTECGLKALSGVSDDFYLVKQFAKTGNINANYAIAQMINCVVKAIGSYIAELGGVDGIVFTGAISKYNPNVRETICESFDFMGVKISHKNNIVYNDNFLHCISDEASKVDVFYLNTDEEQVLYEKFLETLK